MKPEVKTLETTQKSTSLVSEDGLLILNGKGSKQKNSALQHLLNVQNQIAEASTRLNQNKDEKKVIMNKVKQSAVWKALKTLSSEIKNDTAFISDLTSRYMGALEICKKLGIDVKKNLKNVKMLNP